MSIPPAVVFVLYFVFLLFLWIGIRVFRTKRPFLFSARWVYAAGALCLIPLFLGGGSFQSKDLIEPLIIVLFVIISSIAFQAYYVCGGTKESTRMALLHALKKLNIGYEDASGLIKLSGGGEIALVYGGAGSRLILARKMQNKELLGKIAAEVNLYFQMTPTAVETHPLYIVNLLVTGFILAVFAFFLMK